MHQNNELWVKGIGRDPVTSRALHRTNLRSCRLISFVSGLILQLCLPNSQLALFNLTQHPHQRRHPLETVVSASLSWKVPMVRWNPFPSPCPIPQLISINPFILFFLFLPTHTAKLTISGNKQLHGPQHDDLLRIPGTYHRRNARPSSRKRIWGLKFCDYELSPMGHVLDVWLNWVEWLKWVKFGFVLIW